MICPTPLPEESQDSLEKKIENLLRHLNIYGTLIGHKYLAIAIAQTARDPERIRYITKELYPDIAWMYGTTASKVERAMRTAVMCCWEKGGRETLEQIVGYRLHQRPTNSEFIDLIASRIR